VRAVEKHLGGLITVNADSGGMQLVCYLHNRLLKRMDDQEACRRASAAGLAVHPLSTHWMKEPRRQGLIVGYTSVSDRQIDPVIGRLAQALSQTQ
jgi:GntR family transcriptional regulator/MocR family aminotransferase